MKTTSKLVIDKLSKKIAEQTILDEISLEVQEGEFLTILGQSGAGKSMLLNCLAGFESISDGKIFLDNNDITKSAIRDRNIIMVDQDILLFEHMSVYDNIAFGLRMNKLAKTKIKQRVVELANLVEMEDKLNAYPLELSGGQQQRIAIARALAIKPQLLLLDEPFNKLDISLRNNMQRLLKEIVNKEKTTVILVSHDKDEALKLSDKLAIIKDGKIIDYGTPTKLFNNPDNLETLKFFNYMNVLPAEVFKVVDKKYAIINPRKIKIIKGCKYQIVQKEFLGNYYKYQILFHDNQLIIETDIEIVEDEMDIEINEAEIYFY